MATTEADGEISADYNDADIMFAQMMIPHHQQAVEMSQMLLPKAGYPCPGRGVCPGGYCELRPETWTL